MEQDVLKEARKILRKNDTRAKVLEEMVQGFVDDWSRENFTLWMACVYMEGIKNSCFSYNAEGKTGTLELVLHLEAIIEALIRYHFILAGVQQFDTIETREDMIKAAAYYRTKF